MSWPRPYAKDMEMLLVRTRVSAEKAANREYGIEQPRNATAKQTWASLWNQKYFEVLNRLRTAAGIAGHTER